MIRLMKFQQLQSLVNGLGQTQLAHQLMHDGDTTVGRPTMAFAHLAAHVRSLQHRSFSIEAIAGLSMMLVQSTLQPSLTSLALSAPFGLAAGAAIAGTTGLC